MAVGSEWSVHADPSVVSPSRASVLEGFSSEEAPVYIGMPEKGMTVEKPRRWRLGAALITGTVISVFLLFRLLRATMRFTKSNLRPHTEKPLNEEMSERFENTPERRVTASASYASKGARRDSVNAKVVRVVGGVASWMKSHMNKGTGDAREEGTNGSPVDSRTREARALYTSRFLTALHQVPPPAYITSTSTFERSGDSASGNEDIFFDAVEELS